MDCDEALPVNIVIDMSFESYMDESVSYNCLFLNIDTSVFAVLSIG